MPKPTSRQSSWLEVVSDNQNKKTSTADLTKLVAPNQPVSTVIETLLQDSTSLGLLLCPVSAENQLVVLHHLKRLDNQSYAVGLLGARARALPVCFSLEETLEPLQMNAPSWSTLKKLDSRFAIDKYQGSDIEEVSYSTRKAQVLPPFLVKALLESNDRRPATLCAAAIRAINFQESMAKHNQGIQEEQEEGNDDIIDHYQDIVAFLWHAAKYPSRMPAHSISDGQHDGNVSEWSKELHQQYIHPNAQARVANQEMNAPLVLQDLSGKIGSFVKPRDKKRSWEEAFLSLVSFKDQHGHCKCPRDWEEDPKLGCWMSNVKRRQETLPPEQYLRLKTIGFDFERQQDKNESRWEEVFGRLKKYKEKHGACKIVSKKESSDQFLARWLDTQRVAFLEGRLSDDRKERLESLGVVWKPRAEKKGKKKIVPKKELKTTSQHDQKWQSHYEKMKKFRDDHGHCRVPTEHKSLHSWVHKQRVVNNRGLMPKERKQLLDKIGFVWSAVQTNTNIKWQVQYERLLKFRDEHGHCHVTKTYDRNLSAWASNQKILQRDGQLNEERKRLLDLVGFDFQIKLAKPEDRWMAKYEELANFSKKNGHCRPPKANLSLNKWANLQRALYRQGELAADRKDLLDKIGFCWDVTGMKRPMAKRSENAALSSKEDQAESGDESSVDNGRFVTNHDESDSEAESGSEPERPPPRKRARLQEGDASNSNNILREAGNQHQARSLPTRKVVGRDAPAADETRRIPESQGRQPPSRSVNSDEDEPPPLPAAASRRTFESQTDLRKRRTWGECFNKLRIFQQKFGHCNCPRSYDEKLGYWISAQRRNQDKLSQERRDALISIGFQFENQIIIDEREWEQKFERLKAFKAKNGHCKVPMNYKEDPALARFVCNLRTRNSQGRLSEEKRAMLESVGFVFRVKKESSIKHSAKSHKQWKARFEDLVKFRVEHGHCRVPHNYENMSLAQWVKKQRTLYSRNMLPEERKRALETVGFLWRVKAEP